MVKTRHSSSKHPVAKPASRGSLERVAYMPPPAYQLDVEILSARDFRQRVTEKRFRQAHQISFYVLMLVESGRCQPVVDYTTLTCKRGMLVLVRPNQAFVFDLSPGWEGWIAIFRPDYLASSVSDQGTDFFLGEEIQELPVCTVLSEPSRQIISSMLKLMREDSRGSGSHLLINALLRSQLKSLILRLLMSSEKADISEIGSRLSTRFKRFRLLVEKKYTAEHKLSFYAEQLGCTVKSLSRATHAITGNSAKEYLAARINLEAKRLLTHTQMPISMISHYLGFDEPTNFVKFFRRSSSVAPSEFRNQHYSIYN